MRKNSHKDIREISTEERKKVQEISQCMKMIPTKALIMTTTIVLIIWIFQKEIGIEKYQNLLNWIFSIMWGWSIWRIWENKWYMEWYEHWHDDGIKKALDISDEDII